MRAPSSNFMAYVMIGIIAALIWSSQNNPANATVGPDPVPEVKIDPPSPGTPPVMDDFNNRLDHFGLQFKSY